MPDILKAKRLHNIIVFLYVFRINIVMNMPTLTSTLKSYRYYASEASEARVHGMPAG